jgi:predicted permease
VRYTLRTLRRAPAFAITAIVILALGIGATTALFGAVKQLLLDTLQVTAPDQLVRLRWTGYAETAMTYEYGFTSSTAAGERLATTFTRPVFEHLRDTNRTLTGLLACAPFQLNLVDREEAEIADGLLVSGEYFDLLGIRAHLGRTLGREDDDDAASPAATISQRLWKRRFGGDEEVLGRVVTVNGVAVTIVGVLPAGHRGVQHSASEDADLHLPLALTPRVLEDGDSRFGPSWWWLQLMGRLRPDTTLAQAQADLGGLFHAFVQPETPDAAPVADQAAKAGPRSEHGVLLGPLRLLVDSGRRGIYDPGQGQRTRRQVALLGAVIGLVLLLVCTNVANLLLSRATTRRREMALRRSVGATRARVVRQLATEGVVLALLGGALGLLVTLAARGSLPFGRDAPIDGRVLAFATVLSLATGLAFSLVPALRATGDDTASALKESSRAIARSGSRLSRLLQVVQMAVSTAVVVGAGLFLGTLVNLRRVDPGFDPANVILLRVEPQLSGYAGERSTALYDRLFETVRALPGVESVSLSTIGLLTGGAWTNTLEIEGASPHDEEPSAHMNYVSVDFFRTMRIGAVSGRLFEVADRTGAPPVAVINERAARDLFGHRPDVLGARFKQGEWIEVVGVVRDVKSYDLRAEAPPTIYRPHAQAPPGGRTLEVKTAMPPASLIPSLRDAVREIDPTLPLVSVTTQESEIEKQLGQERMLAFAYSLFGGLTLLLASIGLYGLASYGVAQRTNEIGVRMALGARRSDVAGMMLRESLAIVAIGVLTGIVAALVAGRWIESFLFGLTPADLSTHVIAVAIIGIVSTLAAWLPARRAALVDPMVALRCE